MNKIIFWGLIAFTVSLILRFMFLNTLPPSLAHDEMYYAAEARSLAVAGTDLTGMWRPWELRPAHEMYAELPGTVMSAAAKIISSPFVAARATHAVFGSLLPFLLGGIMWQLTKNRFTAWGTLLITLFNPWMIQFSRMSFDALFSIFFYAAGIFVFLSMREWRRLWSLPLFVLGFYQYQGLKLLLLPIIGTLALYIFSSLWQKTLQKTWKKQRTEILTLGAIVTFTSLFFLAHLWRLQTQAAASRLSDTLWAEPVLEPLVNTERRIGLDSPLAPLLSNKATVFAFQFINRSLEAFDPQFLFVSGESDQSGFSVYSHGVMYLIDLILIAAGIAALTRKKKAAAALIGAWALLGPLPLALNANSTWTMFRASWTIFSLILLAGAGAGYVFQHAGRSLKVLLIAGYAFSVLWFGYQYAFRYPVYAVKDLHYAERLITSYISRLPTDTPVTVYTPSPRYLFESFLFYKGLITAENHPQIARAIQMEKYRLGNVRFSDGCLELEELRAGSRVITHVGQEPCEDEEDISETEAEAIEDLLSDAVSIANPTDSGELYRIYNDTVCTEFSLSHFLHITSLNQFAAEKLSTQEFCQTWITDLRDLRYDE
jgi:hypothetical protein